MIRMMKIPLQASLRPRLPPEPPEPSPLGSPRDQRQGALPPRRPRLPRLEPPLGGSLIRSSGGEFGPVDSVDPCRTELVDPTDPMDSTDSMALARRHARTMVASTRDRKDRKDRKAVASGTRTT
ncbi:unnamed protein product [Cladocopium goreaui]|uniref:Uncharacterized protein n=1 Tax=Cladocopium goreaui TaxID=2562237 RepID=A0A9P1DP83_9DINO|nr:unnamed protein product [Cladocopium goreaui]